MAKATPSVQAVRLPGGGPPGDDPDNLDEGGDEEHDDKGEEEDEEDRAIDEEVEVDHAEEYWEVPRDEQINRLIIGNAQLMEMLSRSVVNADAAGVAPASSASTAASA